MKNKKLLLGIGALVLVLVGGLVANSSGLLQGKVRNLRAPQSTVIPATPSALLPQAEIAVELLVNGSSNDISVAWGDPITLSWASENATSCSSNPNGNSIWSNLAKRPLTGSQTLNAYMGR